MFGKKKLQMIKFKIERKHRFLNDEYVECTKEEFEVYLSNLIEKIKKEDDEEFFNKNDEKFSSVIMQITMNIAYENLKNKLIEDLYGKEKENE